MYWTIFHLLCKKLNLSYMAAVSKYIMIWIRVFSICIRSHLWICSFWKLLALESMKFLVSSVCSKNSYHLACTLMDQCSTFLSLRFVPSLPLVHLLRGFVNSMSVLSLFWNIFTQKYFLFYFYEKVSIKEFFFPKSSQGCANIYNPGTEELIRRGRLNMKIPLSLFSYDSICHQTITHVPRIIILLFVLSRSKNSDLCVIWDRQMLVTWFREVMWSLNF